MPRWSAWPRLAVFTGLALASAQERVITVSDCQYVKSPDEFLARQASAREAVFQRTVALGRHATAAPQVMSPSTVPRRNFIDDEIFTRLEKEGVASAALSTDEEFLRRASLDLTGRTPTPQEIRDFLADASPDKRDKLVDRLANAPEFTDKWTMFLGDLLQNYSATSVQSFSNQVEGRNRMYEWVKRVFTENRSYRDLAYEALTGTGNTYDRDTPQANWPTKAVTPMGPSQDSYDMMLVKSATVFLGLGHYDCLLCHNGAGHLDLISAWGRKGKREDAERMAAFFSRLRWTRYNNANDRTDYYNNSVVITDAASGSYSRNTTAGNRPARCGGGAPLPQGAARCPSTDSLTPLYRDGRTPSSGQNWREAFARLMIDDPMFARNFANRLWKQMFNLALAEPVDGLDPLRLDPAAPPPAPWDYQASHPQLLEKLAQYAREIDFNFRDFLKLIATSSAYQLSSRYDAEWKIDYVPLFARHYPRRLDGEEIHDAIVRATGIIPRYTIRGYADPVSYAMQFPEPTEPASDGNAATFLNSFQRGNRDTTFRSQGGSVQMFLQLMNNTFVTGKTQIAASSQLKAISQLSNETAVNELFLRFLSRAPTDYERGIAMKRFAGPFTSSYTRDRLVEDLAWALINKTDFLFSY